MHKLCGLLVQPAGHPPDSKASLLTPRTQVAISCALCGATWPRWMAIAVKSRCGAVAVGCTYLLPPLSIGGALVVQPWLRFRHTRSSNRTSRFPASGSRTRLHALLSRATPSVVSEHSSELIGCPISMSFTTYCVCLQLRSLPSTGITRLHWYYEPLRHPRAPGLSLAGVRLVIADRA